MMPIIPFAQPGRPEGGSVDFHKPIVSEEYAAGWEMFSRWKDTDSEG